MTAEAIHKQAFYMEGESERLTKLKHRRRQAQLVLDFPKYALAGGAVVVGLFALGIAIDLLEYLHRAPTVVALRHALSRLLDWLFTDAGLVSASVTIIVVIVFIKLRKRLRKFARGCMNERWFRGTKLAMRNLADKRIQTVRYDCRFDDSCWEPQGKSASRDA